MQKIMLMQMMKFSKFCGLMGMVLLAACTVNRAKTDDALKKYFDARQVDGSFAMLNNIDGKITVYNFPLDTARTLPASTFKIVNGLIGLQTGAVLNDTMLLRWDGIKRRYPNGKEATAWNKDLTFDEAFRASAVPYFQEVARRIGRDSMQAWLDTLSYGNQTIGARADSFWLDNSLRISPDEQLGLVKKLYFDQLPFRKSVQQSIRNLMVQEANTNYKLSYKTGWGQDEQKNQVGWAVGYIEERNHPYFFSLLVKTPNAAVDMQGVRSSILKDILKHYGFFEGKK